MRSRESEMNNKTEQVAREAAPMSQKRYPTWGCLELSPIVGFFTDFQMTPTGWVAMG